MTAKCNLHQTFNGNSTSQLINEAILHKATTVSTCGCVLNCIGTLYLPLNLNNSTLASFHTFAKHAVSDPPDKPATCFTLTHVIFDYKAGGWRVDSAESPKSLLCLAAGPNRLQVKRQGQTTECAVPGIIHSSSAKQSKAQTTSLAVNNFYYA